MLDGLSRRLRARPFAAVVDINPTTKSNNYSQQVLSVDRSDPNAMAAKQDDDRYSNLEVAVVQEKEGVNNGEEGNPTCGPGGDPACVLCFSTRKSCVIYP